MGPIFLTCHYQVINATLLFFLLSSSFLSSLDNSTQRPFFFFFRPTPPPSHQRFSLSLSLSLFFFLVFSFFLFFYFTHSTMFTNQTHNHGSESLVPFETPFISIIGLILDNHIYKPSHHSSLFWFGCLWDYVYMFKRVCICGFWAVGKRKKKYLKLVVVLEVGGKSVSCWVVWNGFMVCIGVKSISC